jgi:hypothetical protein
MAEDPASPQEEDKKEWTWEESMKPMSGPLHRGSL